ncbi:hypothetical protein FOQG_14651 [Fusarium oxysporum f. sp. raphani 54005]|uniref:Uncharacterized protein n=1 Tax=Fusarium oxysporum f. sp. raphani 54005 TaxID=1089458 RepID=X0BQX4_FUSOX|nr:hypothetical protein FOQG_14651 [Fusarium oxysporum f. sp. raphani 54005]
MAAPVPTRTSFGPQQHRQTALDLYIHLPIVTPLVATTRRRSLNSNPAYKAADKQYNAVRRCIRTKKYD